jgi:hypothetical protein
MRDMLLAARLNWSSTTRTVEEQWVDVMAIEVASQQGVPTPVLSV